MIRKGVARSTGKGSRIYEVVEPSVVGMELPPELVRLLPLLRQAGSITNEDIRGALGVSRPAATRIASELYRANWLRRLGVGRWTRYELARPL
jgi:hypothetical protein